MASEELKAVCQRNLDEAISQYLRVTYGASSLLTDWALVAETVEPNLDREADEHMLWLGTSKGLSTWRLIGLSAALQKIAYASVLS